MNIQDLNRESAAALMSAAGDLPMLIGYINPKTIDFDVSVKTPHSEDPRFVLPGGPNMFRRLEMTRENDEVLVGVFSVPDNEHLPYPLSAQYSIYMVDKKNPGHECGGGIQPCSVPYPPVNQRTKGIDRVDYVNLQRFINEALTKSGFTCQFPIDPGESYHRYWADEDKDSIGGAPGTAKRGKDGALRVLEYVRENEAWRFEVISMPERYTELTQDSPCYSIDVFTLGGQIRTGFRIQSSVVWPPLRERKFGMDYQDYIRTQEFINNVVIANGFGTPFDIDYDKEKPCYMAKDKELTGMIVMKRRVMETNVTKIEEPKEGGA